MGKIEEVTDDNVEQELLKKRKGSEKKGDESDSKEDEMENSNEKLDESDNQESDGNADSSNEEIDFTKTISREELMGDVASYKPPVFEQSCSECEDCDIPDENEDDFFEDGSSAKSTKHLSSKRAIALVVMFPMLASGVYMLYEVFGRFQFGKSSMQFTAAIGGAIIALIIMSNVKALQSAVKFVFCFAWLIFLYPSYQVYQCSPVPLKNDMLGTWFSLKTESSKFLELSYVTSECFQSYQFHTPYLLSVMSVKVSLTVDISDLINLNTGEEQANIDVDEAHVFNYFLLVSKRSVKKKFHKLHMIIEASPKLANNLKESLKLSSSEKEKNLLRITGTVSDIDEAVSPMKKELEGFGYLMRPIKFKVYGVKYIDRYAKLKNNNEGYY